jgi:hypothetical protein
VAKQYSPLEYQWNSDALAPKRMLDPLLMVIWLFVFVEFYATGQKQGHFITY